MAKKLFAILLCVAMLATLVVAPALAAADTVSCDFDDSTQWAEGTVSGLAGKSAVDKSLAAKLDKYSIITLGELTTFEFNIYNSDQWVDVLHVSWDGQSSVKILNTTKTDLRFGDSTNAATFEKFQWTRVAFTLDPSLDSNNLTLYVNGEKKGTKTVNKPNSTSATLRCNFTPDTHRIDDFVAYHGDYTAPNVPVLSSTKTAVTIDNTAKTISMPACSVADVVSVITVANGSISGVVDSSTHMTKAIGSVAGGDLVAVVADDGVTYSYYTVSLKETKTITEDFTDMVGVDATHTGWTNWTADGVTRYACPGYKTMGVGGKALEDASFESRSDTAYFMVKSIMYGKSTIEYSLMKANTNNCFVGVDGTNNWLLFGGSNKIYSKGASSTNDDIVGTYKTNEWYRVALEMDFATGKYNAYVNGNKLINENKMPTLFKEGNVLELRFMGLCYIDDVSIHSGSYTGANAAMPALTAGSDYTVNDETKVVFLSNAVAVAEAASVFGANATVVDAETHLTKTEGSVETGDLIAVVSEDGLFFNYYTAVIEAISNIEILNGETVIDNGLVQAGNLTAKVHITATENASYKLYIAKYEGNALTAVSVKDITIAPEDGGYVDADYATEAVEVTNASSENIKAFLWKTESQSPIKYAELSTEATPVF